MGAELQIHVVVPPCTEEIVRRFQSNVIGGPFSIPVPPEGSPKKAYEEWYKKDRALYEEHSKHFHEDYDTVAHTPSVWIGEVSWLKAALFDDADTYIPTPVGAVQELFDCGFRTIDDELIIKVKEALGLKNTTRYRIVAGIKVLEFLRHHMGKQAFTVSW